MLVFGLLIVAFTAGFTLSKEIKSGTASVSLSKPVPRPLFFLGKFFGVILVLTIFAWCAILSILFAERSAEHYIETSTYLGNHRDLICNISALCVPMLSLAVAAFLNWKYRYRFGLWFFILLTTFETALLFILGFISRTGEYTGYSLSIDARIIPAALLIYMLLCIFAALAVTLSTRLQTGAAIAVAAAVLFVGLFADSQFGTGGIVNKLIYSALPDIQHFWMADALADGGRIPMGYLANTTIYTAVYTSLILLLGIISFDKRDLG